MSNYFEYKDKIAFHPGYYIAELIEECGMTQEDFAKRLGTTPKNLSVLISGEQSLSNDMAMKLSRMLGTSAAYWLNLQSAYNAALTEMMSDNELNEERKVFKNLNYKYFRDNFGLPDLPRQVDAQIKAVREFLRVGTLCVFRNKSMAAAFRSSSAKLTESNVIKANMMVQIAANYALAVDAPRFDKVRFEKATDYALTLTGEHESFCPSLREAFLRAGVIFVVLPNLPGSRINGATKKIGNNIMLMVNDRGTYADTFWFTLFHEIGHIMNGDYGISFDKESGETEDAADLYAADRLIPREQYISFVAQGRFDVNAVREFSADISRDPGIVVGRLQNERLVGHDDNGLNALKHRFRVMTARRNQIP